VAPEIVTIVQIMSKLGGLAYYCTYSTCGELHPW